jgi:hypothetical protein
MRTRDEKVEAPSVETTPMRAEPDTATSAAAKPADMLKIVVARRIQSCIDQGEATVSLMPFFVSWTRFALNAVAFVVPPHRNC